MSPQPRRPTPATARAKALKVLQRVPHRYRSLRALTQALTLAVLLAVPLSGLVRFDAWAGHHLVLRQPSGGIMAGGWVLVAIACFYLITFLLNTVFGRVFCGYGCPVGQASRFADMTAAAVSAKRGVILAWAEQIGYAFVLSGAVLLWWVDPHVLWQGSTRQALTALAVWGGVAALVVLHGRYFSWRFCRAYCPIGLYYSAVQTDHAFGVHFDPTACENCDMCIRACPVNLNPKALDQPIDDIGGIAIDGFPGAHHCLTCGDCVQACEYAMQKKSDLIPLRLSFGAMAKSAASGRQAAEAGIDPSTRECEQAADDA